MSDYPAYAERPVFVCGHYYRWLGYILKPDSTILLRYNNNYDCSTSVRYTLNTWHQAKISYHGARQIASIYLDSVLAGSTQWMRLQILRCGRTPPRTEEEYA